MINQCGNSRMSYTAVGYSTRCSGARAHWSNTYYVMSGIACGKSAYPVDCTIWCHYGTLHDVRCIHTHTEREKHQHKTLPSRDRVASSVGDAAQRLPASLPSITIITITIIIIINRPQRQRNRCVVARIAPRDASASTGCLAALRLKASGLWMRTHARTHARIAAVASSMRAARCRAFHYSVKARFNTIKCSSISGNTRLVCIPNRVEVCVCISGLVLSISLFLLSASVCLCLCVCTRVNACLGL